MVIKPYFQNSMLTVYHGNAYDYTEAIDEEIHCSVTSSDYWKQIDYDMDEQIGMLDILEYIETLTNIFAKTRKRMVKGGCHFQIMNDTTNNYSVISSKNQPRRKKEYSINSKRRKLVEGYNEKNPLGIPFYLSEELRLEGWQNRQWMIWDKGDNAGDMTVTDCPPDCFEWILYHFRDDTNGRPYSRMKKRGEKGALKSNVLRHAPVRGKDKVGHRCPFPTSLAMDLILSCTNEGETIYDPFGGSGNTAIAALQSGRKVITGDLDKENCDKIIERCCKVNPHFTDRLIQPQIFDMGVA